MSTCDVTLLVDALDVNIDKIKTIIKQVLSDKNEHRYVACILTGDTHVHQLNRDYRKIDKTTDVLSFDLSDPVHPEQSSVGEIYISINRAQQQAFKHKRSLQTEVTHLAVHGTLHLLGFEHDTQTGYEKMQTEEEKYLALL